MARAPSHRSSLLRAIPPSRAPLSLKALLHGLARTRRVSPHADDDPYAAVRRDLCRRYQAHHVVLTASGTDALRVALEVAFRARGRKRVALPAYSCYAVATAAVGARAEADLYDVDPHTLSPDLDSLTACMLDGVDAVVVSHLYGYPADVPATLELAALSGAVLVEDAAQEGGGTLAGRRLGTLAPLSVLSFGRGKAITCGGGGALLVRDPHLLEATREVEESLAPAAAGWGELLRATAEWAFGRPRLYGIPASLPFLHLGVTRYDEPRPPRRMAAGAAGLLGASLPSGEGWIPMRRERADHLRRLLAGVPEVEAVRPVPGGCPGELRLPLHVRHRPPGGVPSLGLVPGYPTTLRALEPLRATLRGSGRSTPGADLLTRTLLTAPTHPLLSTRDLEAVRDCLCPETPPQTRNPTPRPAAAQAWM